jgi:hypothetical protein
VVALVDTVPFGSAYIQDMRQSVMRRALTGVLGLWLTASISGVALQACPTHGGMMMPGMATGSHHDAGCGGADSHQMPGAPTAPSQNGQGAGHDCHHGHQCTCPGTCCTTGVVSLAAGRLVAIPVVPIAVAAVAFAPVSDVRAVAAPDVALPPPLGPPAVQV